MNDNVDPAEFADLEKLSDKLDEPEIDISEVMDDEGNIDTSPLIDRVENQITHDVPFEPDDLTMPIQVTAEQLAPYWGITEKESRRLSMVWCKVINKLFNKDFKYKDEVIALVVTGVVIGVRLKIPRNEAAYKKYLEQNPEATPAASNETIQ